MNLLNAVRLKGYASFKDVSFKIRPGISTIYGLNRANGRSTDDSNGVGKSALFGSIPEILYEDPIVGERQDRSTEGMKMLSFTSSKGKRIVVQRKSKGRGEALSIKVDGVEQQFRTAKIAKAFLKKAFPISDEEYNTYVHYDSRVPHPLVMGNSAARKSFFTKFFGLDKIDIERKLYAAELAKLKRTRAAYDELQAQYARLKLQLLSREDVAKYTRLEEKYKEQVRALQQEFSSVQETLRLIQFAESSVNEIKELQNACGGEVTEEAFNELLDQNKFDLKDTAEKLEHAENWEQYQRDSKQYNEAFDKLSTFTKRLMAKYGLDRLRDKASANYDKRIETSQELSALAKTRGKLKDVIAAKLPAKVIAPVEELSDLEELRRSYKHQLDHASKFKRGTCETCGQLVKVKDPEALRKRLQVVVDKLNAYQRAEAYREAVKKRKEAQAEYDDQTTRYEDLSAQEANLLKWQKVHREVRDLPKQPKPFKGLKLQLVVCKKMMEEVQARRSLLKYMQPHLETILEFLRLTKAQVRKARESSDLNDRMNEAQDRRSKASTKLELHRTLRSQVRDMKERLLEMSKQLEEEEPLKHLVQGYQDKNLKRMAIEAISERLMVLVNRYAQKVFAERFTFEFKWDTQIRLLVHRHYGKKIKSSDVRRLSGAESTLFTLILICALLAFVPPHKRCNVLILDEPAARLSKRRQQVFKDLLKILNQLIPSIIVITPHSEVYEGSTAYTVVKDANGEASIVERMPDQIK